MFVCPLNRKYVIYGNYNVPRFNSLLAISLTCLKILFFSSYLPCLIDLVCLNWLDYLRFLACASDLAYLSDLACLTHLFCLSQGLCNNYLEGGGVLRLIGGA